MQINDPADVEIVEIEIKRVINYTLVKQISIMH